MSYNTVVGGKMKGRRQVIRILVCTCHQYEMICISIFINAIVFIVRKFVGRGMLATTTFFQLWILNFMAAYTHAIKECLVGPACSCGNRQCWEQYGKF